MKGTGHPLARFLAGCFSRCFPRAIIGLLVAAGLALVVLVDLAGQVPGNADDAFILLVYARHFAESGTFTYNAGEPPLDGFTSLLDVLLKGWAIRWTGADPVRVNSLATLVFLAACGGASLLVARRASGHDVSGALGLTTTLVGALALCLTPGLAQGSAYMLETPLFGLLLLLGLGTCLAPRPLPLAAASLGLILVRPEGTPIALLLVATAALSSEGTERRGLLRTLAGAAALAVAFLGWRLAVFGHWAPNAYLAKTSSSRLNELSDGLGYIRAHGGTPAGAVLLCALAAAPLLVLVPRWRTPEARRRFAGLSLSAWIVLAGVAFTGGDCYPGARFLMPSLLLSTTGLVLATARLQGAWRILPGGVLVAASGLGLGRVLPDLGPKLEGLGQGPVTSEHFACSREISRRLARAAAGLRVGQIHFQRLKYFADELNVFDLTGLNRRDVAELAVDGPVAFGKDGMDLALDAGVEVLHLDYRWSHPESMSRYSVNELVSDPDLRERFAVLLEPHQGQRLARGYLAATLAGVCGSQNVNVFVRRDLRERFEAEGFRVHRP